MVYSRGSRLISLFTKYTKIMEIETRYLVAHNPLSMVVLILRRLLHMEDKSVRPVDMDDESVPAATRRLGFDMCRDSIGGVWADIAEDEFCIQTLSGGLTNYLYVCSLPPEVPVPDNQPQEVLLRVYGHIATSSNFVVQNSVIFALMSEKRMGPKLYGMNPKARIEELIPAQCLRTADLARPTISRQIAQKLARFHALDMPLCKEPRFLTDTMDSWMLQVNEILNKKHSRDQESFMQKFRNYNLSEELNTLKSILASVASPVVFSHNDLQEGNILYTEDSRTMTVIDWEYCSYNYRGYDFGNHFLEWCYNYHVTEAPYYSAKPENYPSRQQQMDFFRAYLSESNVEVTESMLDGMYQEANTYALASHFLWGLWAILQNEMSTIQFGFMEYAVSRFEGYLTMKERRVDRK